MCVGAPAWIPGLLPLSAPHATVGVPLDTQLRHSRAFGLTNFIRHYSLYFSKEKKGWGLYLIVHTSFRHSLHNARVQATEL